MPDVSLQPDEAQVKAVGDLLRGIPGGLNRAISGAINVTLRAGVTQISKRIRKDVSVAAAAIKKAVKVDPATSGSPQGAITITRRPIPLIAFSARQTVKGASVLVRRDRGRQLLAGSFIRQTNAGSTQVMEREGTQAGGRVPRKPIKVRMGPTILGTYENVPGLAQEIIAGLGERLAKNLASKADYVLNGPRGGGTPPDAPVDASDETPDAGGDSGGEAPPAPPPAGS